MRILIVLAAVLLVSETALGKTFVIQPGQSVEIGRDTVTCSASVNPASLVHIFYQEGCKDRRFSFPVDWTSKENTLRNCNAAAPSPTGMMQSYSVDGTCQNFVGFASGCKAIVEAVLGH